MRGSRPHDESWRADALAGSRHSRWIDELREPSSVHDQERAEELCGQVSRLALQDFAPALLLMTRPARRRVQALTAYTLTLFDFARQTGLEGERLTGINRWDFELESALDGHPTGQPVFVQIHALELERSWSRDGFDRLHAHARRRIAQRRPPNRSSAERDAEALASSLAWTLLGEEPAAEVTRFIAGMLRLRGLQDLGDDLRRHRIRLPVSEVSDSCNPKDLAGARALSEAIEKECDRLDPILGDPGFVTRLPADLRAPARYSRRASQRLLERIQRAGLGIIHRPPRLGLLQRVGILFRSRWL